MTLNTSLLVSVCVCVCVRVCVCVCVCVYQHGKALQHASGVEAEILWGLWRQSEEGAASQPHDEDDGFRGTTVYYLSIINLEPLQSGTKSQCTTHQTWRPDSESSDRTSLSFPTFLELRSVMQCRIDCMNCSWWKKPPLPPDANS